MLPQTSASNGVATDAAKPASARWNSRTAATAIIAPIRLSARALWLLCILLGPAIVLGHMTTGDEPLAGYLDEVIASFAAISLVAWRVRRSQLGIFSFVVGSIAVMAFFGVVSALGNRDLGDFPIGIAAPLTVFLDNKALLVGLALAFFVLPQRRGLTENHTPLTSIIFVFAILPLLNVPFVLRDIFSDGTSLHGPYLMLRSGFYAAQGVFPQKYLSGICFAIGVVAATSLYLQSGRFRYAAMATIYIAGTLLSQDVKSLLSELLFVMVAALYAGRGFRIAAFAISLGIIVVVYLAAWPMIGEQYERFVLGTFGENIRTSVWPASLRLMAQYFPFGSGAGTFGSMASFSFGYSSIYYSEGIAALHGGSPQEGGLFLMDFMWPKFIAEYGAFGALAVFGIYVVLALRSFRGVLAANPAREGRQVGLVMFSLGMFIFFFVQSAAIAVVSVSYVVVPLAVAIAIAVMGVGAARRNEAAG